MEFPYISTTDGDSNELSTQVNSVEANLFSGLINNLASNTYSIEISDQSDCSFQIDGFIHQPDDLSVNIHNIDHVSCHSYNDGSFSISTNGGTAPYELYLNGQLYSESNELVSNLLAGTYEFYIKDKNDCQTPSQSVVITQPDVATTEP